MAKIYAYQIATDEFTSYRAREPHYAPGDERITELCTIGGTTYISVPDSVTLPDQPVQVVLTEVVLTDELRSQIKAASPHVSLINSRIVEMIRLRYNIEDEIKMLRLAPSDESTAYNAYAEECRAWGRGEKAKFGL